MTIWELTDTILYLYPDAKFSCWDTTDLSQYMGSSTPIILDNKFIDWNPTNPYSCPTQEEINNCDQNLVKANSEILRKEIRNISMQNDKSIVASFKVAQMLDNNLTWSDFLDSLEEQI